MRKWSRKADPHRDERVYLVCLEARRTWKSMPSHEKRRGQSSWDHAKDVLEKNYGLYFNDIMGVKHAYYRGVKVHRSQDFTVRKTGRQDNPDAVQQFIIYDLVCKAVRQGHSEREAFRIASDNEHAMINKKGKICRPSPGAVKYIYRKWQKIRQQSAAARNKR